MIDTTNILTIPAGQNVPDIPKETVKAYLPGILNWDGSEPVPVWTYEDLMQLFHLPHSELKMTLTRS